MVRAIFFWTTWSKDVHTLLEFVWKIQHARKWLLSNDLLLKQQGICTLLIENSLNSKEIMINFLTHSVRIGVKVSRVPTMNYRGVLFEEASTLLCQR